MDLTVMNYVVSVADSGNFSLAAEACHVGQPALSQQIARLEAELGVKLFSRNPRGAHLTEPGREFVRRAREILLRSKELEEEMALFAGFKRGQLTLGIISSIQCIEFGSMLASFVWNFPDISFSLRQSGTYQLIDMLQERTIDLAFLNFPPKGLPAALSFERLGGDRYGLAVPYDHPLALSGREEVSMKELSGERFIFHQPWQVASDLVMQACLDAGFHPNIVCRSGEPTNSLYMVEGGMGVALFPEEEFSGRQLEGVCHLRIREDIIKDVGVVWRKDSGSPLITEAVRFAKEWSRLI